MWKNDALTRTVAVRPDGKISLPLLDDVQAAGLTTRELRDVLTEKLREFISSAAVAVVIVFVGPLPPSNSGPGSLPSYDRASPQVIGRYRSLFVDQGLHRGAPYTIRSYCRFP